MRRAGLQFALLLMTAWTAVLSGASGQWRADRKLSVSDRNLVPHYFQSRTGQTRNGGPGPARIPAEAATLKILAIMAEFQEDDDEWTTGNGRFLMEAPEDPELNAPPHDRPYFEKQLRALSHYYQTVSGGALVLEGTVFPDIVQLHREMGDYNPGTTDERTDQGLAELMRDVFVIADDSFDVRFSDYDVFVIFHAGVGRDIDLGYDPSPRDIPSVFLNRNDLSAFLGEGYANGIAVENGGFVIEEAIILPETQNQEDFEFGLLGTMTLMFGFQLGMPALWDTEIGRSGAGRWAMMDQGSGNYSGMIPCEPCAFSKVFLGWVTPVEVRNGTDLTVACSAASDPRKIYKVPINDSEYFLIENRRYDADFDSVTYGTDASGRRIQFPSDGYLELDEQIDVIVGVDEYDYGLPGSGILIWHVDESVILARLEDNAINTDRDHKGVDLEEADGAQDIGESYGFLSGGSGAEGGVLHDAWFADNDIHKLANGSATVAFTPDSYPDTRSYTGANSHIVIDGFSVSDTLMRFSVSTDWLQPGFPQRFAEGTSVRTGPVTADLDGDGDLEILIFTIDNIYAFHHDGTPVFQADRPSVHVPAFPEPGSSYYPPVFDQDLNLCGGVPVAGDWDGDGLDELFAGHLGDGRTWIRVYHGLDSDGDGSADLAGAIPLKDGEIPEVLICDEDRSVLMAGTDQGNVYQFSPELETVWMVETGEGWGIDGMCKRPGGGLAVLYNRNGPEIGIMLLGPDGAREANRSVYSTDVLSKYPTACEAEGIGELIWLNTAGGNFVLHVSDMEWTYLGQPESVRRSGPIAIHDLNGDGIPEGVTGSHGQITVWQHNGAPMNGFPVPHAPRSVQKMHSLTVADVNADGRPEIGAFVFEGTGVMEFYSTAGDRLDDFTLSAGDYVHMSIADVDLDGDMEILACSEEMLHVWDLDAPYSEDTAPWPLEMHDPGRTGLYPRTFVPGPADLNDWMPVRRAYNYPNPNKDNFTVIRYYLAQQAHVEITIYDLAGEKVDAFPGPGLAQADNEVRWNLSGVASGVYVCHIRASTAAGARETTFKIGVVK
ncbi:VCBS repeat-containing protein [bacterium]|nr:VCBS repeat-containing protein [bacterium]